MTYLWITFLDKIYYTALRAFQLVSETDIFFSDFTIKTLMVELSEFQPRFGVINDWAKQKTNNGFVMSL